MLNKAVVEEITSEAAALEAASVGACWNQSYAGRGVGMPVASLNAFSAIHLLRNYNQLLIPPGKFSKFTSFTVVQYIFTIYNLN